MPHSLNLTFTEPFRSIKNFQNVSLPQLTVISGPNGSGKTHFLESVALGKIAVTNTSGVSLKSIKFDSTPNLTATHVTHGELLENQTLLADAKDFIEAIEALLSNNNNQTNIYFNNAWQSLNRETFLQVIKFFINFPDIPQFDRGDKLLYQKFSLLLRIKINTDAIDLKHLKNLYRCVR